MDTGVIVLRVLHIFAGIAWAGVAWFFYLYMEPILSGMGPEGGKFMQALNVRRYPIYISAAAAITILAGWTLFFMRYGLNGLQTGPGLTFAIGGIFGLIAGAVGGGMVGATGGRLTRLGEDIAKGGKPPTPEQQQQMAALRARLHMGTLLTALLVTVAVFCMAIARYV